MSLKEKPLGTLSGWWALLVLLAMLGACAYLFWISADARTGRIAPMGLIAPAGFFLFLICLKGFFVVNPNEAIVAQFFGRYAGSCRTEGLRWTNPLNSRMRISLRARNFESARLKVNDLAGNPIEIAAVVVWRVVDSAEAAFQVDNYEHFVKVQTESAVRSLATRYAYDAPEESAASLRGSTAVIAQELRNEIQQHLSQAGVSVLEARLTHLAYAPEIATAMLRRQQASAVVAARQQIVAGAVGMVELALDRLARDQIVNLDEERKAAMVSNLLVVLCADRETQPVINAGTLYP